MDKNFPKNEHDACGIGAVVSIDGVKSHSIVDDALSIVEKLEHRAGKDADGSTGDGVGIMLQIPHEFFKSVSSEIIPSSGSSEKKAYLPDERDYGVGMFFFSEDNAAREDSKKLFEKVADDEGLNIIGWRKVPVNPDILGKKALATMPLIEQCFIERPKGAKRGLEFERRLYIVRRRFEKEEGRLSAPDFPYVCSLSSRTIVYKGMFLVGQLRAFFFDLQSELTKSAMAMVHSRFSTNTNPSWHRAHPNRVILHNGEINTIHGNVARMISREETLKSEWFDSEKSKITPIVNPEGSDSARLDNTLEFLEMGGVPLPLAVMMTIPEPWKNDPEISRAKRDMYKYYSTMMEPWDGPAAILFSDGDILGAVLDRNGLRPSRYYVTKDRRVILASEVGVLDIPAEDIVLKSRLTPGRMLLIDTVQKTIVSDQQCKNYYATREPFGEWLDSNMITLASLPIPNKRVEKCTQEERDRLYKSFGYAYEDVTETIIPMARDGLEGTAAMGNDTTLAVLSERHAPLFTYFKQLFAQVTNPPIDSLREKIVTDTTIYLGLGGNLLNDEALNCRVLEINNPILTSVDLLKIRSMNKPGFKVAVVSLLYDKGSSLKAAIDRVFTRCDAAFKEGANIIILSDRGVDEFHVAIPSLLAVSAVEQHHVREKRRTAVSIVLESAEPVNVHHFALLLGYGAHAVNPYLAHECIEEACEKGMLDKDPYVAIDDFNKAIRDGIVKVAAKMGISTLQSYQSAQIFEAVGICSEVIDKYFTGTVSPVEGIGLAEIEELVEWRHNQGFDPLNLEIDTTLDSIGKHKMRSNLDSYDHMFNANTVIALREATQNGDYKRFKEYSAMVGDEKTPHTLRGLLDFVWDKDGGIPIDEVESASEIVKRFKTGAMSYGSISEEAHTCMAKAMNTLGGRSNSGEGGENPARLGTDLNSAIKQVASGRFGVTSEYLCSANEIQIKMAQGAKPGEGGHLPGKKVYPWIAKTRHSTPGVALISPPPHHDIYSIEDLAQLIYDLKCSNKDARITVKLVSENGVGTIASGVAKAGAQVVLISGYDGGTGAAPRTSIHDAGLPWELGVAETHKALIENGLRGRVRIETDGKLMTGRDVAIAALLGAEEFGFATGPLITMGCVMMRICNLDTCPVGVATQNPELRARFKGKPEYVMNFMLFIAEELREIMAKLGVRTVDELVGRTDLLRPKKYRPTHRAETVDLSGILTDLPPEHFRIEDIFDFELEKTLDESVLLPAFEEAFKDGRPETVDVNVSSINRTFGTITGSVITKKFGDSLADDTYIVNAKGGGGQSFGAFIPKGLTIRLTGDANDYFGKGLSGGKLVLKVDEKSSFVAKDNIIVGNVALYGATSGFAFINGIAGERFCVRNSGASAVVEGCGDHGCEYMTGGRAVILGRTGKNFAAGMSGGIAYVLDEDYDLYLRLNKQLISISQVTDPADIEELKGLIEAHVASTDSEFGKAVLDRFDYYLTKFKKIVPHDFKKIMDLVAEAKERGASDDDAKLEAFYRVHSSGY